MLIKKDPDTIKSYFEDSSNLKGGHAESVVFPENIEELAEFLRGAYSEKIPVNVSGGGTGTTGARVPFDGIVVSMERFNKIIDIAKDKISATIQAGVMVDDLKKACEREGLFYPCHPTEQTAFVGGTVATNASGARSFKYGPTRRHVNRLEMILADGAVCNVRRGKTFLRRGDSRMTLEDGRQISIPLPTYQMPHVKNSAGYFAKDGMDLIDLFIGQEGTLSVITEIEFGLVMKPEKILSCFVFFKNEKDAWCFSSDLKKDRALDILSIEYFDSNALGLVRLKNKGVPSGANAAIFFEEEATAEKEGESLKRWQALLSANNASLDDTWYAMTEKEAREFMKLRHSVPEAINDIVRRSGFQKLSTDIAVPDGKFLDMMNFYQETLKNAGIRHVIFGHIGENHVHVNLLPKSERELKRSQDICLEFIKKGVALGGTVSAEHGIGKTRHRYLEVMYGEKGLLEMARVKKTLDPNCILGSGNIFPKGILDRA